MNIQKRQLGSYLIEREVGRGGMGAVYHAKKRQRDIGDGCCLVELGERTA